jgi:hypothetical protein
LQTAGLGLGPVMGNSVQILGVSRDLLEEPPSGSGGGQVLLALIFFTAALNQAVIVNRILPGQVQDPVFNDWREPQERWVQTIEEIFSSVPVASETGRLVERVY